MALTSPEKTLWTPNEATMETNIDRTCMLKVHLPSPRASDGAPGFGTPRNGPVFSRLPTAAVEGMTTTFVSSQPAGLSDAPAPLPNLMPSMPGITPGMLFPSNVPTQIPVPMVPNANMMYFNPQAYGYDSSSCGYDPRKGYPLEYPYVPLPGPEKKVKHLKKGVCC